ncbi:hypothetical protein HK100_001222 [Physocladia obscura]|uniref:NAD(P)-binding protein n=1 Tax=Physocladia obscura TaxID=109957 RepID=A0AAD5SXF0_9FUNG|nr:hypothetical protein HK100_001222 [Physocladia obscura]
MFAVAELGDLRGQTIVVTGATSGLGFAAAAALAGAHATVVITARDAAKGDAALQRLRAKAPSPSDVHCGVLDQRSLESVRQFALWLTAAHPTVHCLMLNAGVFGPDFELIGGCESHFLINHLAPFLLVKLLLPALKASPAVSRIVFVSSDSHRDIKSTPDWTLVAVKEYHGPIGFLQHYGWSKLANAQTSIMLAEKLASEGVTHIYVNAVHPGALISTNADSKIPFAQNWLGHIIARIVKSTRPDADFGCLTQVYLAASKDVVEKGYRGQYFVPTAQLGQVTEIGADKESQQQLWELSEKLVKDFV